MPFPPILQPLSLPHLPPDLKIYIAQYTNLRNAPHLHAQLLQQSSSNNPDPLLPSTEPPSSSLDYALIDTTTLISPTHLHAAIFRACTDFLSPSSSPPHPPSSSHSHSHSNSTRQNGKRPKTHTRGIHAEIVLALGYTSNISKTLKTFGLKPENESVTVVKIIPSSVENSTSTSLSEGLETMSKDKIEAELEKWVDGDAVEFSVREIRRVSTLGGLRGFYKLERIGKMSEGGGGGGGVKRGGGKGGGGKEAKVERRRRRKEGVEEEKMGEDGISRRDDGVTGEREVVRGKGEGEDEEDEEDEEEERAELEMQILGLMALRGAT